MFENIGASGFIMIVLIALLLFGPSKLPELGRAAGNAIREFKKATGSILSDEEQQPAAKPEIQAAKPAKPQLPD